MKSKPFEKMTLFELQASLKAARSIPDLNAALQKFLLSYHITTYSFTYYSYYPNSLNKLKYDFATPNFEDWHKHYIGEHYEEIDTTLEKSYRLTLPVFWDLETQIKQATTAREKKMRLDSLDYGTEKGITIPIHGPREDFATFVVFQMQGENCLEQWHELEYILFVAGYYYYAYLQPQLLKTQEPVEKFQLNKREMQCLVLIAKQYSMNAIAKNLNITVRTVNYHIQRLNKKLGTKNKYQSVAKALQNGLIKI